MPILSIFGLHASVQSFLFGSVRKTVDAALFMVNGFRKKYCFFVSIHAPVRVRQAYDEAYYVGTQFQFTHPCGCDITDCLHSKR